MFFANTSAARSPTKPLFAFVLQKQRALLAASRPRARSLLQARADEVLGRTTERGQETRRRFSPPSDAQQGHGEMSKGPSDKFRPARSRSPRDRGWDEQAFGQAGGAGSKHASLDGSRRTTAAHNRDAHPQRTTAAHDRAAQPRRTTAPHNRAARSIARG